MAITISDLERSGMRGPVWVLNNAFKSKYQYLGELFIPIPNGTNKADTIKIDQTYLPQNLANRHPRSRLLESTEFRRAVAEGLITIIPETEARAMLNRPDAHEEQARLDAQYNHVKQAGSAKALTRKSAITLVGDGNEELSDDPFAESTGGRVLASVEHSGATVAELASAGVNDISGFRPSFLMFADRVATMTDVQAINALRTRGRFSRVELKHLVSKCAHLPRTLAGLHRALGIAPGATKVTQPRTRPQV